MIVSQVLGLAVGRSSRLQKAKVVTGGAVEGGRI